MQTDATTKSKLNIKKIVSYLGTLLMLMSLGFIARRLLTYGMDFSLLTSPLVVFGILGVAFIESLGMVGAGWNYRTLIRNVSGAKIPMRLGLLVYLESNLYKYIPGGVMYVLGRNRLAVETDDLRHSQVAAATIFEGMTMVFGAVVVALVFSFDYTMYYIQYLDIIPLILLIAGILLAVVVPTAYFSRHKIMPKINNLVKRIESPVSFIVAKRVCFALFLMFMWGASFVATLTLLGQPMTVELAIPILGIYLLAWLAGFITPGAPSGFGVREAVMLFAFEAIVYANILLAAMVVHRVLTVLGDVMAYLIAFGYARTKERRG